MDDSQCICGDTVTYHKLIRADVVWCSKCGSIRMISGTRWQIPMNEFDAPSTKPAIKIESK